MTRSPRRRGILGRTATSMAVGLALVLAAPVGARAQDPEPAGLRREIQESQMRLEEIRAERERLQQEMATLRNRVEDVSGELRNIERQLSASRSVLAEIEFQTDAITLQIKQTSGDLLRTREALTERNAVLQRRLRDIYKRGQLHSVRVLLGADSFADLLSRYRYLQLIARYDRTLVEQVALLEGELVEQDQELRQTLSELGLLRQDKLEELAQLRRIETERQRALESFRSQERQTMSRLDQLEEDEQRLRSLMEELETRRRELERRRTMAGGGPAGSTLSGADAGSLDWPVEGEVIYRFGRETRPNGTVLRWNGLGIRAETGTPVRAVRDGVVVLAGPFEGYGPTVVISHGGGFYTLYLYLEEVGVVEGRQIQAGQVLGTVGGAATPEGPHLEFQIRAPLDGGTPQARDPLQWLRPRAGGDGP